MELIDRAEKVQKEIRAKNDSFFQKHKESKQEVDRLLPQFSIIGEEFSFEDEI